MNQPTDFDFNPARVQRCEPTGSRRPGAGDQRFGEIYVYHREDIALAVKVAVATERPLLVGGPPGSGKSSLARNAALTLGWRFYERVVTSRTEARDLFYTFDSIGRLNDAALGQVRDPTAYIEPAALWWAIDPATARVRGSRDDLPKKDQLPDPSPTSDASRAVVLIDEIDKADIDVPNALLVPLGSFRFRVEPIVRDIEGNPATAPLVILTTNGERELPPAFLRRCIVLELPGPDVDRLVEIAEAVIPDSLVPEGIDGRELFQKLATIADQQAKDDVGPEATASTAEYLDMVEASLRLGIGTEHHLFSDLLRLTNRKRQILQEAFR